MAHSDSTTDFFHMILAVVLAAGIAGIAVTGNAETGSRETQPAAFPPGFHTEYENNLGQPGAL
jgi:hypothetical protein